MILTINGTEQTFQSIKSFREQFNLPASFGTAHFQQKEWEGLGTIDRAGNALNTVRDSVLEAIPEKVEHVDWLGTVPVLATHFESKLVEINDRVGLRDEEIAFAVNGFGDVCNAVAFAIVRAKITHTAVPPFEMIYRRWLDGTVSIGGVNYDYAHKNDVWAVRLVLHAYGRVGLEVRTSGEVYYVVDKTLACPAEGYMVSLLAAVATRMIEVTA